MKNAIAIAAIAGLATAAVADLTVNIEFGATSIAVGETTSVTMTADFTGVGAPYMSVANFSVVGDNGLATASGVSLGGWNMAALGAATGSADGAGVSGIKLQQQALFGAVDTTATGLLIASWTVTADAEGVLTYSGVDGAPFSFGINDANNSFGSPVQYGVDVINSGSLTITPAPSAMALLGLGGLVAGRRRR
ncbi:MAG: hypothetical protein KC996_10010 [Phycisphaerales bacterium]|nr:hypothetical protein [Phycisphaerales bacterium]